MALAGFGIWRHWRTAPLAAGFFAMWTAAPIMGLMAVTYLIHPLEFPRYALIAFVGMFALAAFGAASLRPRVVHLALAAALIALSLGRTHHAIKHPYEAAWRQATEIAAGQTAPDEPIAVFPEYCKNVVRYYLSPERRSVVQGREYVRAAANTDSQWPLYPRRGPDRRHGEVLSAGRQAAAAGGGSRTLMGRTPALALLVLALMLGAGLRFYRLGDGRAQRRRSRVMGRRGRARSSHGDRTRTVARPGQARAIRPRVARLDRAWRRRRGIDARIFGRARHCHDRAGFCGDAGADAQSGRRGGNPASYAWRRASRP